MWPSPEEKLKWIKPEPPSEEEKRCSEKLEPGDYEIGFERTNNFLDEALEVAMRTSRSSFGVAGDAIVAVFTAKGDLANSISGTYLHAIIQPILIKFIRKRYSTNPGIKDGDIWFTNDAAYGGIHNPDQVVLMPVFYEDKLVAWTGAAFHSTETGAIEPGGMPIAAKSRFEEGMNFPPIKVGENYELKEDFIETITAYGVRDPERLVLDLRARAAAADRARIRLIEMIEREGLDYTIGLLRKMLEVAEEGARRKISMFPDGKYRCVTFGDSVGPELGLVRNCYLTLIKEDDRLIFDFTGTGPETPYSYNAHVQCIVGHVANFVYEHIFYDLPMSSATFAPIDFIIPKGTCYNPDIRAATSNSVMIATGVMSALHNVFAKMIFSTKDMWHQVTASNANAGNGLAIAGINQWGRLFADMLAFALNTEGQGGRPTKDGMNAYGFSWCLAGRAPNTEEVENEDPILILMSNHWTDSSGHGKFRGGAGTVQLVVLHQFVDQIFFMAISDNSKVPTVQPLFGGYAPSTVPGISVKNVDVVELLKEGEDIPLDDLYEIISKKSIAGDWMFEPSCRTTRPYSKGEVITFAFSAGGAGYGDPLERDPEMVINDLKAKIISEWTAKNVYKVKFDPETLKLDKEGTEELRKNEKKARLLRGKPYEEFIKGWVKKRPPEEVLKFYGSWPDAKPVIPIIRP